MPAYKKISPATGRASWFASFYYTDWTGKKRQKKKEGFEKRADALEFERGFLERQAASPDMSFSALCDLYLADYKENRRETSYITTWRKIKTYIQPFFADMPINEITPAIVRQWQAEIKARTAKYTGEKLSPPQLRNIHVALSAMFNFAMKYHNLTSNPARLAGSMGGKERA